VLFRSQQHLDTYNRASRREKLEFLVNRVRLASQVIVEDSGATQVLSFLGSRSRYEELFSVSDSEMRSLQHFARDTSALREAGRVLELYERRFHRGRQRAQLGTLISEIIDLESRVFSFAHRNSNLDFKAEARLFLQELDRATPERRAMMLEAFFHSGGVGFTAFRTAVVQLLENPNETRVRAPVVRPNEVAIDISLEGVPPPPVTSPPMAEPPENPENSPQRPQISARILMSAEAMAQSMVGTFRFGGYRSYPGIRFEADLLSALESELVNLPADSSRIFLDDPFRRNRFASERDFLQPSGEFRRRWIVPPDRIDSSLAQDRLVALVRRVPGQSLPEPILDDLNDPLLLPERMANFYRNTVFRNESAIEFLPTLDSQDLPMGTRLNFGQNQYKSEILAAIFDQTGFLPFGFSCGNLRSPDWDKCTRTNNGQRVELVEVFERILERLSGFTMRYQINATPACKFFHSYHLLEAAIRGMPQETRTRAAARDPIFQRELALIERYGQRGPNPNVEEMCRTL
jgi:hypothetical protein